MSRRLYLDTAAAAPVRREALEAAWPYLAGAFGNPSSHHEFGRGPAEALADARSRVAAVLGMRATDITFTSGGTEADNLAIIGIALGSQTQVQPDGNPRPARRHIVTSAIEHEAVLASAEFLSRVHGFTVTEVGLHPDGTVTPEALAESIRPDTALVSLGYANNEIGTVADIPALAAVAHEAGALFPHGCGAGRRVAAAVRARRRRSHAWPGTRSGRRRASGWPRSAPASPSNRSSTAAGRRRGAGRARRTWLMAVAFATALELAEAERTEAADRVRAIRDEFIAAVLRSGSRCAFLTGSAESRSPNHASFCFSRTSGEAVLLELERLGVTASSGSACAVGDDEPSHVLTALGIAAEVAQTSVRFTFPSSITAEQGRAAARAVVSAAESLTSTFA
jgi:cysteine desulfurase